MDKLLILFAVLYLSGTVRDKGFYVVNNKIVLQKNSQLKVKQNKNLVTVSAL